MTPTIDDLNIKNIANRTLILLTNLLDGCPTVYSDERSGELHRHVNDALEDGTVPRFTAFTLRIIPSWQLMQVSEEIAECALNAELGKVAEDLARQIKEYARSCPGCELVFVDQRLPSSVENGRIVVDPDAGLALRVIRAYDLSTDTMPCRFDLLFGIRARTAKTPELNLSGQTLSHTLSA